MIVSFTDLDCETIGGSAYRDFCEVPISVRLAPLTDDPIEDANQLPETLYSVAFALSPPGTKTSTHRSVVPVVTPLSAVARSW